MNQELFNLIKTMKGGNPQQIAMNLLKQSPISDPIISQLIAYAKNGDNTNLLNLATNFFKQRGADINEEFNNFMTLLK